MILAGSELGQGRMLFVTTDVVARGIGAKHTETAGDTIATLHLNIKSWLTRHSSSKQHVTAVHLGDREDLREIDIHSQIIICLNFNIALSRRDEVLEFVRRGGDFCWRSDLGFGGIRSKVNRKWMRMTSRQQLKRFSHHLASHAHSSTADSLPDVCLELITQTQHSF